MTPAESAGSEAPRLVDVAVPVPLAQALTYSVPIAWRPWIRIGSRVRVRVGRRRLVGVAVGFPEREPEGVTARDLDELVDLTPVVDGSLLELARFTADYYLAPIGEVMRTLLPRGVPSWGSRRVRLTDAGALARPTDDVERRLLQELLDAGTLTVAELQRRLGDVDATPVVARLAERGRVRLEESSASGSGATRYVTAYELPRDRPLEQQLEACGRSAPGRAVVQLLATLGRPATLSEIRDEVGCTDAVVRRLHQLGVVRKFTQIERLSLERHLLEGAGERDFELRADQQGAVETLCSALDAGDFASFLLSGVTGSGKTAVYLRAAEHALAAGRSVLILVPEIALVPALARTARAWFGDRLAILHSNLGRAERHQEWERVKAGQATVVVGPRSAIFAPLARLGLVVVDEEHDGAYKQEVQPRYNGRDLALVRARAASAVVVLTSATPSLETRLNVERGRYEELHLVERVGHGTLPEGILVDLRREAFARRPGEIHFSERLGQEVERALAEGEQVILLRNRRGYAPLLLCRACGEEHRCEDCGLPMTFHRRERSLVCHYCGRRQGAPSRCGRCAEAALEPIGAGTERVEERFRERFPGASVDVLDRDSSRRRGGAAAVLERFRRGETQVLIGTQMVSKGHHFPQVSLTAVLAADTYLGFPDFRAVERTYSLLTQLAGRAGRGDRPGRVVIQTFNPDHYAIQAALVHDDGAFAEEEMRFRRVFHYPPYTRMVQLLLRDRDRQRGERRMRELAERLAGHRDCRDVRISGPAPAPLERLRGEWRFQLLLRSTQGARLRHLVGAVLEREAVPDLTIDVDPYDLL